MKILLPLICKTNVLSNDENYLLLVNIALGKPASHSPDSDSVNYVKYAANKGNDGSKISQSITLKAEMPWWTVDLQDVRPVRYMILTAGKTDENYNRELIVDTRQNDSEDWKECKNIGAVKTYGSLKFVCNDVTSARYLRVRAMETCHLTIKEFEVF